MFEELTWKEERDFFLESYKGRCNLFEKELTELLLKSYKEKYNSSEEALKESFPILYEEKYSLSNRKLEKLFLEVYKEHNLSKEELKELYLKLYNENRNLFEEKLKESFLELYKEKHNLSEEELLEFRAYYREGKAKLTVAEAAYHDLLPVIKYFIENGGDPYFVMDYMGGEFNIFNIAAKKGSLDIINYLLDKNIFTVDQRASKNSKTPFHSAVEGNNIKVVELLLKRGADINAKFEYVKQVGTAWFFVVQLNLIEMAKFLLKQGIFIPKLALTDAPVFKNFLLSMEKLENLQGDNLIKAYKASTPEAQEIWDARIAHLTHENITTEIAGVSSGDIDCNHS
ncbi:MAG TPA: ankyrin repeat domain-containing protein [Rickettsia endosymbiont of Omalisus fontisbellaquei]|nr:ankyrin repeat domain-containing protein [Rickettsia endosymbiont of Omalisus fontisbellaquei]